MTASPGRRAVVSAAGFVQGGLWVALLGTPWGIVLALVGGFWIGWALSPWIREQPQ